MTMKQSTTALSFIDAPAGTGLADAIASRSSILDMTQAAEEAVLRPAETGAWSYELRAALAARIAFLNDESALGAHYQAGAGSLASLADVANDGAATDYAAVVAFMDMAAARTKSAAAEDIATLKEAGVGDADIVRLAELNAFISYQVRVIAGLRLLKGDNA